MSRTRTVEPIGEIDVAVVAGLRQAWSALIDDELPELIVVDLGQVTFMDSTGLSLLIGLRKKMSHRGGELRLRCARPQVQRILRLTNLDQLFPGAGLPNEAAPVISETSKKGSHKVIPIAQATKWRWAGPM
jgi:anti-anti-sigma factor